MNNSTLPVPHISQIGLGADRFRNDCGAASAAMLIKAYTIADVTPDEIFAGISQTDRYLRADELMLVLYGHAIGSIWKDNQRLLDLFEILVSGKPAIALISYAPFVDAGLSASAFRGSHFVVVVGMDIRNVYVLDPLQTDHTPLAVPIETWMRAWTEAAKIAKDENPPCGLIIPNNQLAGAVAIELPRLQVAYCEVLNVRDGPGLGCAVVGTLKRGDVVSKLEDRDGWIRHGANRWSFGQYLSELQ